MPLQQTEATWNLLTSSEGIKIPDIESAVLLELDNKVIVLGGYQDEEPNSDTEEEEEEDDDCLKTYLFDGTKWTSERHKNSPSVEGATGTNLTPSKGLLHGGLDSDYETTDGVQSVSLSEEGRVLLTRLLPEDRPAPARYRHSSCLISNDQMFLFGGRLDDDIFNTSHVISISAAATYQCKHLVPSTSECPSPRFNTSTTTSNMGDKVFLFGGAHINPDGDQKSFDDLWEFTVDTCTWRKIDLLTKVSPRNGHLAFLHRNQSNTDIIVVICGSAGAASGGGSTGNYPANPLLIDTQSVTAVDVPLCCNSIPAPIDRYIPCGIYSPMRNAMLVVGGTKRVSGPNDVFELRVE